MDVLVKGFAVASVRVKNQVLFQAPADSEPALGRVDLAGTLKDAPGLDPKTLRKLSGFALVYVLRGRGWYRDEHLGRRKVQAGDLILLFPGSAHTYGPEVGSRWDEVYICFSGPVFDLWRKSGALDPSEPIVSLKPLPEVYARLLACVQTAGRSARERGLRQLCRLQAFLAEAFEGRRRVQALDESWFDEACHALQGDTALPALAKDLGMSYESFRKKFKEKARLSPGQYREQRKLDQARGLMRRTRLSNKQLAEMLGFYDEFHFSRRFKQRFGVPPKVWRKTHAA